MSDPGAVYLRGSGLLAPWHICLLQYVRVLHEKEIFNSFTFPLKMVPFHSHVPRQLF